MTDKVMCPKCSPNNFCRDPKHGNSEDNPAHKSSCRICSHGYFNNVSNEQVTGREGGSRGNQPMHNHSRHNSYGEGRGEGGRRGQRSKDTKEELELLKHKAEVDKLKEEDIERQLRMASKKIELKELKNENREKYEEENKEEKCEEEDKDTETINKGGQSKKHKEDK